MKKLLLEKLSAVGQEHLLAHWDRIDTSQQKQLCEQIEDIDFHELTRLYQGSSSSLGEHPDASQAKPPPAFRIDESQNQLKLVEARSRGEQALLHGKVGVILVAGGQGSRLGFDHPKGMLPLGPISRRTLFQMHFDQLRAMSDRYGRSIPMYLMTSPATHRETIEYFKKHSNFGMQESDLHFFCQGTMPAVDIETGRVLLADIDSIALSPDGHGGTLTAFEKSGCLENVKKRGIEQLYYFQVDNPLIRMCEPELLGYHLLSRSEMSTQVVAKHDPFERVGNVVQIDGKVHIIEYSDLSDELAQKRNADGGLTYWAGNIAVHVFDVSFLERIAGNSAALPFHLARKKMTTIDAEGKPIVPSNENAIKFERFIFDLLPLAKNAIVVEVEEATTFAPVKNANGAKKDTPQTAQSAISALHRSWLKSAGISVADSILVEINPRYALDAEELSTKIETDFKISSDTYFDVDSY